MSNDSAQKGNPQGKPRLVSVGLDLIDSNPYQPRHHFGSGDNELDASIAEFGVLQPPLVRNTPGDPGRFQLADGERRTNSARRNSHDEILVIVREFTDEQMAFIALEANERREDLNAIDKALAMQRYMREFRVTHQELAQKLQMGESTLSNLLRLLELPEEVQQLHIDGKLSQAHCKLLCSLTDWPRDITLLAQASVTEGWSSRQLDKEAARVKSEREAERQPALLAPGQPALLAPGQPALLAPGQPASPPAAAADDEDDEPEEQSPAPAVPMATPAADDDDEEDETEPPRDDDRVSGKGLRKGDRIAYSDRMGGATEATVEKVLANGMLQVNRGPRENGLSMAVITEDDSVHKIEAAPAAAPAATPEPPTPPTPASTANTSTPAAPQAATPVIPTKTTTKAPAKPKVPAKTKATDVPTDKKTVAMIPGTLHNFLRDQGVIVERAVAQYRRLYLACAARGIDVDAHLTQLEEPDEVIEE